MAEFSVTMADIDRNGLLTQELLERLAAGEEPTTGWTSYLHVLAMEVKRHRSAIAADKERVQQVVRDVIATVTDLNGQHYAQREIDAIAARVADRLATPAPKLTEEERNHLLSIRAHLGDRRQTHASTGLWMWSAELATLDRLLAGAR